MGDISSVSQGSFMGDISSVSQGSLMGDISSVSTVVLRVHLWVTSLLSPQWFSGFTYG